MWFSFLALVVSTQHLREIERTNILRDVLEAQRDLSIAQPRLGAELTLDVFANASAGACKMARHGGLVFAEQTAGLGERQLLNIVATEPQPVPGVEAIQRAAERPLNQFQIAGAIGLRRGRRRCDHGGRCLVWQRLRAALGPPAVDMPLRQHRAQPGCETAPSVKVTKQRLSLAAEMLEPIKIGIQRVGQIACAACGIERIGRAIQHAPLLVHEVLPGPIVTRGTRTREREIAEVQRGQIAIQLTCGRNPVAKRPTGARLERLGEQTDRKAPSLSLCLAIQPFDQRLVDPDCALRAFQDSSVLPF